jgi:ribosomal protein S18 acetylase RimI-like enzyme
MSMKIRPMIKNDRAMIIKILKSTPEFTAEEVEVAIELIDIYLEQGVKSGYYLMVSEVESDVSGYICYGPTPMTDGTWDIYWIAVAADKQRLGIGRSLMQYTENEIQKARGRLIMIETSSKPSYEKTRKFYQSINYNIAARIIDFYTIGDDKLILEKRFKQVKGQLLKMS